MITWFTRHPTAANLLMLAIMLLGLVSLPGLQRETFPTIKNDKVEIRVIYKGATTAEVEDGICRLIEEAVDGVTDLDEIRCEAREGVSIATAVMREGASMMGFLDDLNAEVDAITNFPQDIEPPIITELGRTDAVVSVAMTGPANPVELKAYAENVKARLQALPTLATVTVKGFSDHHIRIEVPKQGLQQYGLSAASLANIIKAQSISLPGGRLEGRNEDILLRVNDRRKTVNDFKDLVVISGKDGAVVRLGEMATITDRFDRAEDKILFNGKRAAVLNVTKTRAQDILTAYDSVVDFVAQENHIAPKGIQLTLTQNRSAVVKDRLNMLVRNGLQGLILVFLVLWLFFNLRYSFWVTMGLPVSFLGALFVLPMVGITINMISMVGLLIGIGLLMDDAIVIAENIATRLQKGDSPMQAAATGVKEVSPGILSSFATTLLVFGSLSFITGEIGQILRVLPIVLIMVISVSLLEAFLVLPNHLGHSLAHAKKQTPSRFRQGFEKGFNGMRDKLFMPVLEQAIAYRYLTIGIVLMLLIFAVSLPAGGKVKFVGFPDIDGDIIEARVLLPQGTPLSHTDTLVQQITAALERSNAHFSPAQPDQQALVQNITVIYGENPDAFETGPHVARVIADLLGAEIRNTDIDTFREHWRQEVGTLTDIIALKFSEPTIGPGGRAIDVRLIGDDLSDLKAASHSLQHWFNQYRGVIDISDDLRPGKREYQLHLKDSAGALGIDASQLSQQVRTAFQGMQIDEFASGAEIYEVNLRLITDGEVNSSDLEQLLIVTNNGALIPLTTVAKIEETRGWARIQRIDGRRAISIQGDVQNNIANAQELLTLAQTSIFPQLQQRYPNIHIDVQGKSKESAKTGQSIIRNVLLGLIGVYMLLALQFRGYLAPITVMSVIPTALIGVIFGHWLLGLPLTMPSIVGMASLFGVVVNDSILLVVFIRQERAAGIPVPIAAKLAGQARFRPIVLTSITTVAGLAPLLMEQSLQAQVLIPLATSLAFGLGSTTLLALFLVPSIYCILDDFDVLGEVTPEDHA